MAFAGQPLSLKFRAIAALSRREYSRSELAKKLAPHAESREQLDTLLDALETENLLSNERFAESLLNRRSGRFGSVRITLEMQQHGLADHLITQARQELAGSEVERCHAVWQKKFDHPPADLSERARQTRFLLARGFSAESIRQALKGGMAQFEDEREPD